jgi:hypothetical protein
MPWWRARQAEEGKPDGRRVAVGLQRVEEERREKSQFSASLALAGT